MLVGQTEINVMVESLTVMDEEQILEHIVNNPPTCVKAFHLLPAESSEPWNDSFKTVYQLECKCGNGTGKILGYPLKAFNPNYAGKSFITPIGFQCVQCNTITEILDTKVHGYHAEVAKLEEDDIGSTTIRGSGSRSTFACSDCFENKFEVTVGFVYWEATFDIMSDEPELPGQDFFTNFFMYAQCQTCSKVIQVTEFDKL